MPQSSSCRILRAYFQKRAHSNAVGSLLKDFQIEWLREDKARIVGPLTEHPPSFQMSPSKDFINGNSFSRVSHNTSNTGSSKSLEQHASATAVALSFDLTSSRAMSLMISSTVRHVCIGSIKRAQSYIGCVRKERQLTVNANVTWEGLKQSRGRQVRSERAEQRPLGDHRLPTTAVGRRSGVVHSNSLILRVTTSHRLH